MKNNNSYKVLGLMSGTSLDGLDIALCSFSKQEDKWGYKIIQSQTLDYSSALRSKLRKSNQLTGLELTELDYELGRFFGESVIQHYDPDLYDFIASHGHTVFHQPENGLTLQIGNGQIINSLTKKPVVWDFRTQDMLLGGQGAPLVPLADRQLFGEFDYCINLGGIANISFEENQERLAYDIGPCNMVLNQLAQKLGLEFDQNGKVAESGTVLTDLLDKWNNHTYFSKSWPKSLGYEWVSKNYFSDLDDKSYQINDLMATAVEHISQIIIRSIGHDTNTSVLMTGGGAKNDFLIQRIRHYCPSNIAIVLPDKSIIDFKEAVSFAYLGLLKVERRINVLASVTGASADSSSGLMIGF